MIFLYLKIKLEASLNLFEPQKIEHSETQINSTFFCKAQSIFYLLQSPKALKSNFYCICCLSKKTFVFLVLLFDSQ